MNTLESRVSVVENNIHHIQEDIKEIKSDMKDIRSDMKSDFRWIMASYAAGFIILLGVMAHGFHWI